VDRIDDLGGTLQVIDYKTSKSQTSRPQLKQDFQMALYWLGTEQIFDKPVSEVGHWYLRMDKEWMVELSAEEREAVLQRARDIIAGIESQQFPTQPSYQVCMYCDYGELCDNKGK
jgi:CRISPR/Cas system-associated exonuclease Cas4 (RecB family)